MRVACPHRCPHGVDLIVRVGGDSRRFPRVSSAVAPAEETRDVGYTRTETTSPLRKAAFATQSSARSVADGATNATTSPSSVAG